MKKQLLLLNIALLLTVCLAAQPTFLERIGNESPFGLPEIFENGSVPDFADIDGDGDFDLFLSGGSSELVSYYENIGTATNYNFVKRTAAQNPIHIITVNANIPPYEFHFYDIDNDNDLDFIWNNFNAASSSYYENIGSSTVPNFIERTGNDNPFQNVNSFAQLLDYNDDGYTDYLKFGNVYLGSATGFSATPFVNIANNGNICIKFFDIDNDGDKDGVLLSPSSRTLSIAENIGSNANPNYFYPTVSPFGELAYIYHGFVSPNIDFADLDNDGYPEVLVGSISRHILTLFNNENSNFILEDDFQNLFYGFSNPSSFEFVLEDINGDDKLDLMLSDIRWNSGANLSGDHNLYFKNEGGLNNPKFKIQHINNLVSSANNPFSNLDLDFYHMEDFDGDGDLDLLNRLTTYYENTGTATNPTYVLNTNNPSMGINSSFTSTYAGDFVDIDDDGDLDFLNGDEYYLYDNTSQMYVLQTNNILPSTNSKLSFVDFDNDEDFDCFITYQYAIYYYENIGDKQNPNFILDPFKNPFSAMTLNLQKPNLEFGDIDNDGDLDILLLDSIRVIGLIEKYYYLRYFENQTIFTATNETGNQKTYRLHAFPNPSTDRFTIEIPSLLQDKTCTMQLVDITGRVIRQRQYETLGNQLQINDLANQPNGIYILNLRDDERSFQVKLVKQ